MADARSIAVFADSPAQTAYLEDLVRAGGLSAVKDVAEAALLIVAGNKESPDFQGPIIRLSDVDMFHPGVRVVKSPVRGADLILMIEKELQSLSSLPAFLQMGDARLDIRQAFWIRGEETIRLTEKEVAILVFLHKSGGKPVTREALLSHVWDYADGVETHTLETHIYRLRQKIEEDPSSPKILLTQGDGYKIPT